MTSLIDRVKNILISPATEWPTIANETDTVPNIFQRYVLILALIPALASFLSLWLRGAGAFGFYVKVSFFSALTTGILTYVLTLVMIFVMSKIVNLLAPTFGGKPDNVRAFQLMAYSVTASMVAGVFQLIPFLGFIAIVAGFYSMYLLYKGLPVMMEHPADRNLPYFLSVWVCGIIAGLVMFAMTAWVTPSPSLADNDAVTIQTPFGTADMKASGKGKDAGGSFSLKVPGAGEIKVDANTDKSGNVVINAPGAKVELDAKKIEEFNKKIEELSKSGKIEELVKVLNETAAKAEANAPKK